MDEDIHGLLRDLSPAVVSKVKDLLRANPQSASFDLGGVLPLHTALQHQRGNHAAEVIIPLLNAYPEAARAPMGFGRLPSPLHYAIELHNGLGGAAVIEALLQAAPEMALTAASYDNGALPLHLAARHQDAIDGVPVVQALLKAAPEAALTPDCTGSLPLHYAALHQGNWKGTGVAEVLLWAAPEAAKTRDDQGQIPLKIALQRRCNRPKSDKRELSDPLIQLLRDAYYEAEGVSLLLVPMLVFISSSCQYVFYLRSYCFTYNFALHIILFLVTVQSLSRRRLIERAFELGIWALAGSNSASIF